MAKNDRYIFIYSILFVSVFLIATVSTYIRKIRLSKKSYVLTHIRATDVIGTRGRTNEQDHKYILVEFADYQCPPCRAADKKLPSILAKHSHNLRFVFRNYPLTDIHPFAMDAALLSEAAREQGRFQEVHDALYSDVVCRSTIDRTRLVSRIDQGKLEKSIRTTAKKAIQEDIAVANTLGIDSTPTFLICNPKSGKVIKLASIDDFETAITSI